MAFQSFKEFHQINEGGELFSTRRIVKDEIGPTVKALEARLKMPLADWVLGSAGTVPTSGDIDIAIDATKISKAQLTALLSKAGFQPDDYKTLSYTTALKFPIYDTSGQETDDFIQVDLMSHQNPTYLKWFFDGSQPPPLKNINKNQLLGAYAKTKGLKLAMNGLVDRNTNKTLSQDPKVIAKTVFGPGVPTNDLQNIPKIIGHLRKILGPKKLDAFLKTVEADYGVTYPR